MKTPSEAVITRTLKRLEAERPPDAPARHRVEATRAAMSTLFAAQLAKAGFDGKEAGEILKADAAELERIAAARQAEAIKASGGHAKLLERHATAWRTAIGGSLAETASTRTYALIEKPVLIIPTRGLRDVDWEALPLNSYAKFTLPRSEADRTESVSFYYLWNNPSDRYAVIHVGTFLIFNGFCTAGVGGGFFPGDRYASLSVSARMTPLEWWNNPPTSPPAQADAAQTVLSLEMSAYGWSEVGELQSKDLFRGVGMAHQLFLIPPNGVVIVQCTAEIRSQTGDDDGSAFADFASGDFKVGSPFVLVTTLT